MEFSEKKITKNTKRKVTKEKIVEEPITRTTRYAKSSLPFLSKLLNNHANKCAKKSGP